MGEADAFGGRSAQERKPSLEAVASGCQDLSPWGYISVLVALDTSKTETEPELVGSVALVNDDLAWRQLNHGLKPWLANLFVPRHARHRGIGNLLTEAAVAEAARLGHEKVFLYMDPSDTKLIGLYQRWGFKRVQLDRRLVGGEQWRHGNPLISVMERNLRWENVNDGAASKKGAAYCSNKEN